jgi:hypothetical protein
VCLSAARGYATAMQRIKVRVSTSDGAEAGPELELEMDVSGDPTGEWWTARTAPDAERPPGSFVEGPVVVTLLAGDDEGSRADAWARPGRGGDEGVIVLEGSTPFVAPAAGP